MPELAEVETIRRQLLDYLPFAVVKETRSPVISSILHTPQKRLQGDVLVNLKRHGKILIFQLQSGRLMVGQLGMTGHWRISTKPLQTKHIHLQLQGKDHTLSYIDPRRFGHIYIWQKSEWQRYQKKQGIDPSSKAFNPDNFCQAIQRFPQRMVKVTLLDQSLFSGIGNYMANEICALARIRPTRRCHRLSQKQLQKLFAATLDVTSAAVRSGGTAFQGGYQDAFGQPGKGVQNLVVFYQKICQLCHKTEVKKIFLQNRGTYYCPACQK